MNASFAHTSSRENRIIMKQIPNEFFERKQIVDVCMNDSLTVYGTASSAPELVLLASCCWPHAAVDTGILLE